MDFLDWITDFLILAAAVLLPLAVWSAARSDRWRRAVQRMRRDRIGIVAGLLATLYLFLGALESFQLPAENHQSRSILGYLTAGVPAEKSFSAPLGATTLSSRNPEPLHGRHLLGTDALGKDVFIEALRACKTALIIGGVTSVIYIPVGTILGIVAGYFRGWVDDVIQYVYTVLYSVPEILLLIAILVALGGTGWTLFHIEVIPPGKSVVKIAIALSVSAWINLCRLIRGETMRQNERAYIMAARAVGQSHWNIITHHLLPNVMHLVVISMVLTFSNLVLAEAILSYLGVGSPVGTPSWGNMIDSARGQLQRDPAVWWVLTTASLALFGLVLSLNLFGDALRRAFDPRRA